MALGRPIYTGFDDFFEPHPFWVRDPMTDIVQQTMQDIQRDPFLVRSSPGYQIHSTDENWKLAIDVPGVQASDMKVDLEQHGRLLHLSGGRKVENENGVTETRFDKRFTIGDDIDTTKLSANLDAGVLTVTAPKKEKVEPPSFNIPITEGPRPAAIDVDKKE